MSVLFVDAGNTRVKWLVSRPDQPCDDSDVIHACDYQQGESEFKQAVETYLTLAGPHRIVAACVKTQSTVIDELSALDGRADVSVWLLDAPLAEPIKHCYERIERLGVDRWLAMLGAQHTDGGHIAVSAGTALTIDLIDADGRHLGGWITPGRTLSAASLFAHTSKVNDYHDESAVGELCAGTHTVQCVAHGVLRQQVALVRSVMDEYPDYSIHITGGDGEALAKALSVRYAPSLIFDGMKRLCAQFL